VRGAVCRAFGAPLGIEELVLDSPRRGEVCVRVEACAVCHSDVSLVDGAWGGTLPAVYGHEAAGVVEAVGQDVGSVGPGDRVAISLLRSCGSCFHCARDEPHLCEAEFAADEAGRLRTVDGESVVRGLHTGAFAELVVVDRSQIAIVPPTVSFEVAALLGCGVVTGFGAVVDRAHVPPGASVAVLGSGGIGLNTIQAASIAGAASIVAADVVPAKCEAATRFGATHTVDASGPGAADEIVALTGGRGADFVFVTVGRIEAIESGLRCVRRGGTLVVVGMPPSGEAFRVEAVGLAHDDVRILGSKMGSTRLDRAVPRLVGLYEEGRLKLDELITGRYPLERIDAALAAARDGEGLRNVVVFNGE
jgi:Zn-dependent alcohol dehydrogenase